MLCSTFDVSANPALPGDVMRLLNTSADNDLCRRYGRLNSLNYIYTIYESKNAMEGLK